MPGDVQALQETTVYPRTSGYLKQWLVDIGDEVKAGQLLAVIDTPDVDQQLSKAKATLGQLKARQITAESDLRLADTTLLRYESLDRDNAVSKLELDQRRCGRGNGEIGAGGRQGRCRRWRRPMSTG